MDEIKYELTTKPNAYGFGRDWSVVLTRGTEKKYFWLGQDVKVMNRILDISMTDGVKYYSEKANSKNFDVISHVICSDILRKMLKTQRITQEKLETLFNTSSWEYSI